MLAPIESDRDLLIIGGELGDDEYRRVAKLLEDHPRGHLAGSQRSDLA
jgi:hypothetical protein